MSRIVAPTKPYLGTRQIDKYGGGGFGARRTKTIAGEEVVYTHKGLDFVAPPGHPIIMPAGGIIQHIGTAYLTGDMFSIHIKLDSVEGDNLLLKLLYVQPVIPVEERVERGQPLGYAQDIAAYHNAKEDMTPHVHLEAYRDGELINPATLLELVNA